MYNSHDRRINSPKKFKEALVLCAKIIENFGKVEEFSENFFLVHGRIDILAHKARQCEKYLQLAVIAKSTMLTDVNLLFSFSLFSSHLSFSLSLLCATSMLRRVRWCIDLGTSRWCNLVGAVSCITGGAITRRCIDQIASNALTANSGGPSMNIPGHVRGSSGNLRKDTPTNVFHGGKKGIIHAHLHDLENSVSL